VRKNDGCHDDGPGREQALSGNTNQLAGPPTMAGTFPFRVTGSRATQQFSVKVS
jgi:hypothetical protein